MAVVVALVSALVYVAVRDQLRDQVDDQLRERSPPWRRPCCTAAGPLGPVDDGRIPTAPRGAAGGFVQIVSADAGDAPRAGPPPELPVDDDVREVAAASARRLPERRVLDGAACAC